MKIRVGTRGSRLAITQTNIVIDKLKKLHNDLDAEVVIIKTKGDKILNKSLDKIGDKGLFVKEIEEQLLKGTIDMAVHSMKDMPGDDTEGLILVPVLEREDPRDVLVTKHQVDDLNQLPNVISIATGSKRRLSQAKAMWSESTIEPIRGNVETRINKMLNQHLDGTILAAAGINRIGLTSNDDYRILAFTVEEMIPAPAQGVLALQVRKNDDEIVKLTEDLKDIDTVLQTEAERGFLKILNGGCHLPMGAFLDLDNMLFYGLFGDEDCKNVMRKVVEVTRENAVDKAKEMAKELVKEVSR